MALCWITVAGGLQMMESLAEIDISKLCLGQGEKTDASHFELLNVLGQVREKFALRGREEKYSVRGVL